MTDVPSNLIPTRITQLPLAPVADENSLMMIVYQGNNYQIRVGDLLSVAGVPTTRQVIAGTGMTGGGQLSSNVTLSIAPGGVGSTQLANSGVTPGVYGTPTNIPVFTVDATGRVVAATTVPATISGFVPDSRQVIAGTGLSGGGALTSNVTLTADLSNAAPLSGFQAGSPGVLNNIARADHRHPAVNLGVDNEVDGVLGVDNGGTGNSLVPNEGGIVWSGADGLYIGPAGVYGQVLVSAGQAEYIWANIDVDIPRPANTVRAGPVSGADALPTFRALVNNDLPGTISSKSITSATITGSSINSTPIGAASAAAVTGTTITANTQFSGPGTGITGTASGLSIGGNAATATSATTATTAATATTAITSTNVAGGAAGSIPYQTAPSTTALLAAGSGVLVGGTTPSYSTTPTLTGTNFSGIPNGALTNSGLTLGTTSVSLGGTALTLSGLTSISVTQDPVSALQLATKQYVDAVAEGLHVHASCAATTTGTLASITGGTVTYNNGTAGVGATLTLSVALTILDGYTLQNNDRILVKNQANTAHNGIYTWATGGTVLTRATDFDTAIEMASGDFTFITNGTLFGDTGWVQIEPVNTIGTDPIVFVQFSGAGTYTAGTGLSLTGNQFSLSIPVTAANGGTGQTSYTTGDFLYATGSMTLARLGIGAANRILTSSGSAPQWVDPSTVTVGSATTATTATSATSATTATNLAGGSVGSLPYQSGAGATTLLPAGSANFILRANGAAAPSWVAQSTLSVGSATTATTATSATTATTATTANNVASGAANQIVFNTGSGATSFITAPSLTNTFLRWNGTAFDWSTAGTGTVTSVAVSGGTTGLTVSGSPITSSGTITLGGTVAIAHGGTNGTATPTAGAIAYGTGTAYAFTLAGTSNQVLISGGTGVPTWANQSALAVGTATNLAGGTASQIPYQTGVGTTAFIANGASGQVLRSNGTSAPSWAAIDGGSF